MVLSSSSSSLMGQNKFVYANRKNPQSLSAMAPRTLTVSAKKSDKDEVSLKQTKKASAKTDAAIAKARKDVANAQPELTAPDRYKALRSTLNQIDLKAIEERAQKAANEFKAGNFENYEKSLTQLAERISDNIEKEPFKSAVSEYAGNGVEAHVAALSIATELVNSASDVANGKATLQDGARSYINKFFEFQKLGFQTSLNMVKTTANLVTGLLGKGEQKDDVDGADKK